MIQRSHILIDMCAHYVHSASSSTNVVLTASSSRCAATSRPLIRRLAAGPDMHLLSSRRSIVKLPLLIYFDLPH